MELAKKILIPLLDPANAAPYLRLAEALLPTEGKILALKVVRIPEETSLSEGAEKTPTNRAELEELKAQIPDERVELRTLVRVSYRLSEEIAETMQKESCDLLLLPWKGYTASEDRLFGNTIDKLLEDPPGRIMVTRLADSFECNNLLLPVRGGAYAEFALEVADQLSNSLGANVTVLHCEHPTRRGYGEKPYYGFLRKLRSHRQMRRLLTVQAEHPERAIVDEAKWHDMVIVGAAAGTEAQKSFLGSVVEHVAQGMQKPLMVVKTSQPVQLWLDKEPVEKSKPISERVDKWFAENSFHAKEFADHKRLVEIKEKQGLTISLGLPALNEAETLGNIIHTIKRALVEEAPLLDEMILIDSGSTDDTVKIAEDLGVSVYVHQEILPDYGSYRGKGEALWKSLSVLRGDIIAWIDTDIKNIHPGFVCGLLGPLLAEPDIHYVKGFYRRPIRVGRRLSASGGGRVTELTARPFLNLFFPELSGIIQPLAGEYAGRREILERVPFFTGYGVETGLLIDIYNLLGPRAIAQVDLEERIHRNQSLPALSQMSFAIIQVFLQRLQESNSIALLEGISRSMKLVQSKKNAYSLEVREITDHERPPMITIPDYQTRRQELLHAESGAVP